TQKLELTAPLDVVMVRGISQFAEQEIESAKARRDQRWERVYTSPEAYSASVAKQRELLRTIIGAVDDRVDARMLFEVDPGTAQELSRLVAVPVTWTVLEGVTSEGLLVLPVDEPRAAAIVLPDCAWKPRQMVEQGQDGAGPVPLAAQLAAQGCLVLVPSLISRDHRFSGNPEIRMTNIPHREFVYRMAFEMGRHIIGYEVQKILAAIDYLNKQHASLPVAVCGAGEGGLLAMYAAAIDERIDACLVSGYFQERERLWQEPIDRNVWNLLKTFGDADIASLIAPRRLIIEACGVPEVDIPTQDRQLAPQVAAPGRIETAPLDSVRSEYARAAVHFDKLGYSDQVQLVVSQQGSGPAFSSEARDALTSSIGLSKGRSETEPEIALAITPDATAREKRQLDELVRFTQRLLHSSDKVRDKRWASADRSSVEGWSKSAAEFRAMVHEQMIGMLSQPNVPPNPRTRKVLETPTHVGYEVVLDVYPETVPPQSTNWEESPSVIAGGILLLPKDVKEGERRPVVVFQHGLEGTPMDTVTTDETSRAWQAYKGVSTQLVNRGFIVYAPQNPYRGEDAFRVIQRKSNPIGRSLFSYIIEQHRQTLRWLATLPWVDADRIAFYGLSYGGKTAVRVPPMLPPTKTISANSESQSADPGYCLSICSADYNEWIRKNVSNEDRFSYVFTREYEMYEWNMGHLAGYAELATLMAPRPFMVERGHNDGVAPDEWVAWEFAKVRRHYDQLGIGDRTEIEFFDGPHTIHGDGTFAFLQRHLNWPLNHQN
ncbi:MAG: hypothetical protein KDA52_13885, partial [Planctomycetaceae bacterium]|nr:hypothetical protein [Planctomycetaceae bacterium]